MVVTNIVHLIELYYKK